ncbi:MAG: hypothetical protein ACLQIH_11800, partial [Myxococcaceae bacterium]
AQVESVDVRAGAGMLRLNDGTLAPFHLQAATGFVPAPGLAVVAQLAPDGAVLRVHLPSHPSKADGAPSTDVSWVTVLRDASLPEAPAELASLLKGIGSPQPRLALHGVQGPGRRLVELVWPTTHMLLTETAGPWLLDGADRRALPPGFSAGSHHLALVPAPVEPATERRLLGADFPDPWAEQGTLRRASRLLRALLLSHGRGLILHRAGQLALPREDALRRLGDLEDLTARPFGAWVDWALTEDRRAYRTLGMAMLGGEDVEIALSNPDAEVELDSAESALLFACMLQVRENRFLADGELFHVPKDVRVGARGASATSRTGYRYFAHRGHSRVQLVRG